MSLRSNAIWVYERSDENFTGYDIVTLPWRGPNVEKPVALTTFRRIGLSFATGAKFLSIKRFQY